MHTESSISVPLDLVDNILSLVNEDRLGFFDDGIGNMENGADNPMLTLRSCALVSRAWRELVYAYIFKTMWLVVLADEGNTLPEQRKHPGERTRLIWRSPRGNPADLAQLFASSPFICSCVRWLNLRASPAMRPLEAEALHRVLRPLSRLQHVEFRNVTLKDPNQITPLSRLPAVDFLQICMEELFDHGDRWASPEELLALVGLFSEIGHLSLEYIAIADQPICYHGPFPPLQSLSISEPLPLSRLLRSLEFVSLTSLHTVDFGRVNIRAIDAVSSFLRTLGPVLRHVVLKQLGVEPHNGVLADLVAAYRRLDLQSCVNLASITYFVQVFSSSSHEEQPGVLAWYLDVTDGTLTADSITHVVPSWTRVIKMHIQHIGDSALPTGDHALPWAKFEDVLLERVKEGLQSVIIDRMGPFQGGEQLQSRMRRYLPRLVRKGKLVFVE